MTFVWGDTGRRKRRRLLRADSPHRDGDRDRRISNAGSSCCSVSRLSGGDPGARGLHDHECFRGQDRWLWHCTEALGSESCEMVPEEGDEGTAEVSAAATAERADVQRRSRTRRRADRQRMKKREFPPPLQWLEAPGRGVMRAERRDGRLILTEVRIKLAQLLREDGRLGLRLVEPEGCRAPEEESMVEEEEEETAAAAAEERWEWKREGVLRRCNRAAAGGHGEAARWWDHLWVSMAKV